MVSMHVEVQGCYSTMSLAGFAKRCQLTWTPLELPSDGWHRTGHGDLTLLSSCRKSWPLVERKEVTLCWDDIPSQSSTRLYSWDNVTAHMGGSNSLSQRIEHLLTDMSVPMDLSTTAAANPRAPGKWSRTEPAALTAPWGHALYFQYLFNGTLQPVHVRFKQGEMRKKEVLEIPLCLFLLAQWKDDAYGNLLPPDYGRVGTAGFFGQAECLIHWPGGEGVWEAALH